MYYLIKGKVLNILNYNIIKIKILQHLYKHKKYFIKFNISKIYKVEDFRKEAIPNDIVLVLFNFYNNKINKKSLIKIFK